MGCSFTLQHYREILEIAKKNGYAFLGFHSPCSSRGQRVIYLRHDIDICLEEAVEMARTEAEVGVSATYFVLTNSPVYNVFAEDSRKLVRYIQQLGHWVGLHIDPVLFSADDLVQFEERIVNLIKFYREYLDIVPVVSFHRPSNMVLGRDFRAFVSTYSPRFFTDIKYVSDSRGTWREECPCQRLNDRAHEAMQVLIHPIWWKITEHESLNKRLFILLEERAKCFRSYLASNVEPLRAIFCKGERE